MSTERPTELSSNPEQPERHHPAAWAGVALTLVACVVYGVLQQMLQQLPATRVELDELRTNAPALMRLMIVGASAALLNLVAVILCLVGYIGPGRSRVVAFIGAAVSGVMLLAFISIVLVSVMLGD